MTALPFVDGVTQTTTLESGEVLTTSGGAQITSAGGVVSVIETRNADGTISSTIAASSTVPLALLVDATSRNTFSVNTSGTPARATAAGAADSISLALGNDTILSGGGADILNAGGGNDLVNPSSGRDTVTLGAGKDTLIVGADVGRLTRSTIDRVTDFRHADDTLQISKSLLKGSKLKAGVLKKSSFLSVNSLKQLGDNSNSQIVYEARTGIVYLDPVKGKDVPLVQLQKNQSNIAANDFRIF